MFVTFLVSFDYLDVPNSGRGLPRLPYRTKEWDVDFREHLNKLNKTKPVIMCGDLNVAHLDIGNMGLVTRIPVFWVSEKVRSKPASSATETS